MTPLQLFCVILRSFGLVSGLSFLGIVLQLLLSISTYFPENAYQEGPDILLPILVSIGGVGLLIAFIRYPEAIGTRLGIPGGEKEKTNSDEQSIRVLTEAIFKLPSGVILEFVLLIVGVHQFMSRLMVLFEEAINSIGSSLEPVPISWLNPFGFRNDTQFVVSIAIMVFSALLIRYRKPIAIWALQFDRSEPQTGEQ